MSALRRWLIEPQTTTDDVVGGAITGAIVMLVFRYLFDDSWPFAIGAGIAVAIASAFFTGWRRRRKTAGV